MPTCSGLSCALVRSRIPRCSRGFTSWSGWRHRDAAVRARRSSGRRGRECARAPVARHIGCVVFRAAARPARTRRDGRDLRTRARAPRVLQFFASPAVQGGRPVSDCVRHGRHAARLPCGAVIVSVSDAALVVDAARRQPVAGPRPSAQRNGERSPGGGAGRGCRSPGPGVDPPLHDGPRAAPPGRASTSSAPPIRAWRAGFATSAPPPARPRPRSLPPRASRGPTGRSRSRSKPTGSSGAKGKRPFTA